MPTLGVALNVLRLAFNHIVARCLTREEVDGPALCSKAGCRLLPRHFGFEDICKRLSDSSFVNVERKYMYFEVPKAGSTSMKWRRRLNISANGCGRLGGICSFTTEATFPGKRKCGCVLPMYLLTSQHGHKDKLPAGNDSTSLVSFREFILAISQQNLANCNRHWRLQAAHTCRGAMNFSHVADSRIFPQRSTPFAHTSVR